MKFSLFLCVSLFSISNSQYQVLNNQIESKINNVINSQLYSSLSDQKVNNKMQRQQQFVIQQPQVKTIYQSQKNSYQPYRNIYSPKKQYSPLYSSSFSTRKFQSDKPFKSVLTHQKSTELKNPNANIRIVPGQKNPQSQIANYRHQMLNELNQINSDVKSLMSYNSQQKQNPSSSTILPERVIIQQQKQLNEKKQRQQQQQSKKQEIIFQKSLLCQQSSTPTLNNMIIGSYKDTNHVQGTGNIIGSRSTSLSKGSNIDFQNMFDKDFNQKFGL